MENFFYVAIAIAYLVYYLIRAKNANQDKKINTPAAKPRPVQPPPVPRTVQEQQSDRREAEYRKREADQQKNRQSQQRSTATPTTRSKSAFEILRDELEGRRPRPEAPKPEPMEQDPFLERESRYEKTVSRRRDDDHFSETRLVEEYKRQHAQGKQLVHHTHNYFDAKTDGLKSKMQITRKKTHPIAKLMKGRENVRNAIILKEILDRKA